MYTVKAEPSKRKTNSSKYTPYIFYAGASFALLYGMITAYQMRWLCDDIFITFRYIQNWIAGNGIVYNIGERVEGYTHFLWMCLITLSNVLGFEPEDSAQFMGLISFAGILLIFIIISWKTSSRKKAFLPLTAILLALNFDFKIWATGGLETSFFTFLVSSSLLSLCLWNYRNQYSLIISGLLLTLTVLTRPDGILFFICALFYLSMRSMMQRDDRKQIVRTVLYFISPFICIYIPYFIWKYLYYGDIFPNTYYAKSGGINYYGQGFYYIWIYIKTYISSFVSLLGVVALFISVSTVTTIRERIRALLLDPINAMMLLSIIYILVYGIFFVARVGGDFMYARFLHPIVPLMYAVGELSIRKLFSTKNRYLEIGFAVVLLLTVFDNSRRNSLFLDETGKRKPAFQLSGVTDEYWFWTEKESLPMTRIEENKIIGKIFEKYFHGEKVRVLLRGQASLGYYANFYECIENAGLTDKYIAHLPIEHRGRPGHEKEAPMEYLVKRGVHFCFNRQYYDASRYKHAYFNIIHGTMRAEMFIYDVNLMNNLRNKFPKEIVFTDFQQLLDEYISRMNTKSDRDISTDYQVFRNYYFLHNSDPEREKYFLAVKNK